MDHRIHEPHAHTHSAQCGHTRIQHGDHIDYVHNGHLHAEHDGHYDDHVIEISDTNQAVCAPIACACSHDDCGHEAIPHGDHMDYLCEGRLHHRHGDHCDDHGPITVISA